MVKELRLGTKHVNNEREEMRRTRVWYSS